MVDQERRRFIMVVGAAAAPMLLAYQEQVARAARAARAYQTHTAVQRSHTPEAAAAAHMLEAQQGQAGLAVAERAETPP
jgi:hypothetical protein